MAALAASEDPRNVGDWERVASGLGGAALVGYALARPSLAGTLMAVGGAMLIERGVTGQCQLYRALGRDTRHAHKSGTTYGEGKRGARSIRDQVTEASEHSFPASDPPAWTSRRAGPPAGVG